LLLLFAAARIGSTLPIFAVLALLGIARAFLAPAAQSILPNIVPVAALGSAIVPHSSSFQVATIAGPASAGSFTHLVIPSGSMAAPQDCC